MPRIIPISAALLLTACATPSADLPVLRFANIGNAELGYIEAGSGEPLVLVHGGLQDYRLWGPYFSLLSSQYRVVAYSRRNHYPNAVDNAGIGTAAAHVHAKDLAALLNALEIPRAHIVAHSAGAYAALIFAAENPARINTLTVNEPPAAALLPKTPEAARAAAMFGKDLEAAREEFRSGRWETGIAKFTDAVNGDGSYLERDAVQRGMMRDNVASSVADATSPRPPGEFICATATGITSPVLITVGEHSPDFFRLIAAQLSKCLPNSRSVAIPNASHSVPIDNPADFSAAFLDFIEDARR